LHREEIIQLLAHVEKDVFQVRTAGVVYLSDVDGAMRPITGTLHSICSMSLR